MSAEVARRVQRRDAEPPPAVGRGPACVGVDPERFFGPADSEDPGRPHDWERRALAVCRGCAVRASCLAEALRFGGPAQFGVVGGMSAVQRREVLAGAAARGTSDAVARARAAVATLDEHRGGGRASRGVATGVSDTRLAADLSAWAARVGGAPSRTAVMGRYHVGAGRAARLLGRLPASADPERPGPAAAGRTRRVRVPGRVGSAAGHDALAVEGVAR